MTRKSDRPVGRSATNTLAVSGSDNDPANVNDPPKRRGKASGDDAALDAPDYNIGYARPPRQYQFKPGISGNPKGRKKGAQGRKASFEKIAKETVKIRDGGRIRNMSREEALQRTLFARALTDIKAVSPLLSYMRAIGTSFDDEVVRELQVTPEHEAIVADFLARYGGVQSLSDGVDEADDPDASGSDQPGDLA